MRHTSVIVVCGFIACGCTHRVLEGTWHTDIERSADSMRTVGTVPFEFQDAIAGAFDEFEWVIDSSTWTENVVGDDPILLNIGGKKWTYRVLDRDGNVLNIERWTNDADYEINRIVLGDDGCLELQNEQYCYIEFKCRN